MRALITLVLYLQLSSTTTGDPNQSPVTVLFGRNVSLNCSSQYSVEWDIHSQNGSIHIYQQNASEALERGIFLGNTGHDDAHRLTVLGSVENNLTSIDCRRSGDTQAIASYTLSVIGAPDSPVGVRGWVLDFSPLTLRLQWEQPFSHHLHPVTNYTIYFSGSAVNTTSATSITVTLRDVEFVTNCSSISNGIGVKAVNDIASSELSTDTNIVARATHKEFAIEGNLYSQKQFFMLQLVIQFPKLCTGQQISYTVQLAGELSGEVVYHEMVNSEYEGDSAVWFNRSNLSLQDGNYTAIVYLKAGGQNVSSPALKLSLLPQNKPEGTTEESDTPSESTIDNESDSGGGKGEVTEEIGKDTAGLTPQENESNTGVLVAVVAVLAIVVLCCLVVLIVIVAVFIKNKTATASAPQEAKESYNPIYEGPLYENIEERQGPPPPNHLPNPSSLGRRMSGSIVCSVDNVYLSSPISIPASQQEREGVYCELKRPASLDTGEETEDAYTLMSPVAAVVATASFTPYLEAREMWIANRK